MGKQWKQCQNFLGGGSKITADGDCSHEIKRCLLLGRKVMTNIDSILKSRDITLPTKVCLVKAMVFPVFPWCWEGLGAEGEGDDRGWDGWMASPTWRIWVWVCSGSLWWTGRTGVLRFMGSQRVGHDWATELNWLSLSFFFNCFSFVSALFYFPNQWLTVPTLWDSRKAWETKPFSINEKQGMNGLLYPEGSLSIQLGFSISIHERDPGKVNNFPKWIKPSLVMSSSAKEKEDIGDNIFVSSKRRKVIHMEMRCLMDVCWTRQRQLNTEWDFNRFCKIPPCLPHLVHILGIYGDSILPEIGPLIYLL